MRDDQLYEHAEHIWAAVESGGRDQAVTAARRLAEHAVAEAHAQLDRQRGNY